MSTNTKKKTSLPKTERSLKIQPEYRFNVYSNKVVPRLTLCGNWLEEVGFKVEARVIVLVAQGEIVIRTVQE